jgi:GxxExxY protein
MENRTAKEIVDAALAVHKALGPGLLESVYETALFHELVRRGLKVERQIPVTFVYDGNVYDEGFRIDLLVAGCVIVELKSVEHVHPVHKKQLLTYLRLAQKRLGLLINFNTALLKDGITRIANGLPDTQYSTVTSSFAPLPPIFLRGRRRV